MKIILATPPFDIMKEGYGSKRKIRGNLFPPLGLAYLASPLIKSGHQIKIIDASSLESSNEEVGKIVEEFKPDLIGVSSVTNSAMRSYLLVNYLKDKFSKIPIVYGGHQATCFPEKVFENVDRLDLLVYGEAEQVFAEIVHYFQKNGCLPLDQPGTWVRIGAQLIKNPPAKFVADLDSLLPPAYQLFDYQKVYQPLPLQYKKLPVANMLTSRGCPYGQCTFCFEAGEGAQIYRRHSPRRVVAEIKLLVNDLGIKEIAFWDDNFLINEDWIFQFCDLLDETKIKIPWSTIARVDTITERMLKRAVNSGLWNVFLGIESGSQDLLDNIKKGITLDQARQVVKWCNELGVDTRGSFMLALPGETPEKARRTIDFACEIGVTYAQFMLTYPEWGTRLYDTAMAVGQSIPLFRKGTEVTYVPKGYKDASEVRAMQKLAYRKFYIRPAFIWKHLKRLKDPRRFKQYFDAVQHILGLSS